MTNATVPELIVHCAAEIEPTTVDWLWSGRLPMGKLVILDGDPGLGKSTLATHLAAAVSAGIEFHPDEKRHNREPASAIILSYEDGAADTIIPRLKAAYADLNRVHIIEGVRTGKTEHPFSLPEGIPLLERLILETGAKLVVVDPLMASLSRRVQADRDQSVRTVTTPLAAMAERTGACVLALRHLNKGESAKALYRGGSSIAISAAARVVMLFALHPDDKDRRVLAVTKCNIAPLAESLELSLENDPAYGCATVQWCGTSGLSADELLTPNSPSDESVKEKAVALLQRMLAGGKAVDQREIDAAARDEGLSPSTLNRAKKQIRVKSVPIRENGALVRWEWSLPC